ncbi:MAG: helicase-exonuclease AddAB subunit AddA [Peptococcaceae bacterium]
MNERKQSISGWTPAQWLAIKARNSSFLVSAAAGAGKTSVLVERVIRRILDDQIDIDTLLVVTFTNAAAAEMRQRVGRALAQELKRQPYSSHLQRQLVLLNQAKITTIHSFCLDLLRQYFYLLDLEPDFRIADENESLIYQVETLEEVMEQGYDAEDNLAFTSLVDCYGGQWDDRNLRELVLRLFSFSRSHPHPSDWLSRAADAFKLTGTPAIDDTVWGQSIKAGLALELEGAGILLKEALGLAGENKETQAYLKTLQEDLNLIGELIKDSSLSWDNLCHILQNTKFNRLPSIPAKDNQTVFRLKEKVKSLRDAAREKIKKITKLYFFRSSADLLTDFHFIAPLMQTLVDLVSGFSEAYQRAKLKRGLVDFADLEHYALQILNNFPVVIEALRAKYVEVLVDEYQDINGVQENILQLISRTAENKPNIFMVGDVKQSIYRFRLAEPAIFLAKYKDYHPVASAGGERVKQRINLAENFRSRPEIIKAVNFIFRQIMVAGVGEMDYDQEAELVAKASYPTPADWAIENEKPIEFHLIEKKPGNGDLSVRLSGSNSGNTVNNLHPDRQVDLAEMNQAGETDEDDAAQEIEEQAWDDIQREASFVAYRLKKMVEESEFLIYDSKYRPVAYKDIVVLMRATHGRANIFQEEFQKAGIPVYVELGTGYFEATEVETMLSLLKIIDNPRQDIPLVAVLRSPLVSLSAAELAQIRLRQREGDFFDALVQTKDDNKKTALFWEKLSSWRTMARRGTLSDLIWDVYRQTGYYDYVGGLPGGRQRQANLRALYDRARQFETTTLRGLFHFLRFIEALKERGSDLGIARALGENENVVRIMSIHKSKGLEFPVVVAADLGKQFNFQDLKKDVLLHKELGLGPQLIDAEKRLSYPTLAKLAVKRQLKLETLAEELRILYVAMTRAKEKLILVGSEKKLVKAAGGWCRYLSYPSWFLPEAQLTEAKSYLDWLCPAIARHRDGTCLSQLAGSEKIPSSEIARDPSCWLVSLCPWGTQDKWRPQEDATEETKTWLRLVQDLEPVPVENEIMKKIDHNLSWNYPAAALVNKPAKASVTELKHRFAKQPEEEDYNATGIFNPNLILPDRLAPFKQPRFYQEHAHFTLAEKGTLMHLVMRYLDLKSDLDYDDLAGQVKLMVERELLTIEEAAAIDLAPIVKFWRSPLGRRVRAAAHVKRELPFSLALPAQEVYPDLSADPFRVKEVVFVQGIIDYLVFEDDSLFLIDFKTDYITRENLKETATYYRVQLNLYARAIQEIIYRPVKEKYLYFFYPGLMVPGI